MTDTAVAMWRRLDRVGLERCELEPSQDGWRVAGTSLFVDRDHPVEIRYSVALDAAWRTRIVGVHVRSAEENRSVALRADGEGAWEAGGREVPDLEGAIDIDLSWTPATNTIAIRRLGLEVGESADITAAFVPFPERIVEARRQTYTRLAERRYRYRSGDFEAALTVDDHGLVTSYPGLWAPEPT